MVERTNPIKLLRRERGITIAELASVIGIDPVHLELIENGAEDAAPTADEMMALARALGVRREELR